MKHRESAHIIVKKALDNGLILTAYDTLNHKETFYWPYITAVETGEKFAVLGEYDKTFKNSSEAADYFIDIVGYPRARESAKQSLNLKGG